MDVQGRADARARGGEPPSLLVAPASLLANWQAEIERFAPALTTLIAHPSAMPARAFVTKYRAEFEQHAALGRCPLRPATARAPIHAHA